MTADLPALYVAADAAARKGRRIYVWLVRADLALLVAGALLGVIVDQLSPPQRTPARVGAAVLLAAAMLVKSSNHIRRPDHDWFGGRAAAETVKTTAWRYMMRVSPLDGSDGEADTRFAAILREALMARRELRLDLARLSVDARQITARMRAVRGSGLAERKGVFLRERVEDQIRWYVARAEENRQRAELWFWIALIANFGAVVFAMTRLVIPESPTPNFESVFAAAAAAATAWNQLGRHDELTKSYALAAQELMILRGLVEQAPDEASLAALVIEVEAAISREHTMWVAKRG